MTDRQRLLALAVCGELLVVVGNAASAVRSPGQPAASQSLTGQPSTMPSLFSFSDPTPRIAIVYDPGGHGSSGFNELAWEGAKRAADGFDAELKEVTAKPDDTEAAREERLTQLADAGYDPIFVTGSADARAVANVAPKHRGIWFGVLDDGTVDGPNVIGILFNEEQGSFLVGVAAALSSKTGNVGFVGASPIPLYQKYEAGFTAGARAVRPAIKVQVAYLAQPRDSTVAGDAAKARAVALAMNSKGADVIFAADNGSGSGVIEAAHERGVWAIGVNSDAYRASDGSMRGSVLTSMLKRADVATYTITMEVANGVPKDGNNVFDLDRGGVGYATSGGFVDPIRPQLDAFAARIASGGLLVPSTP